MGRVNVILKEKINRLARLFYRLNGYEVEEGYDFSKAPHPQERLMWQLAEISLKFWEANS